MKFDQEYKSCGTWNKDGGKPDGKSVTSSEEDELCGLWLNFGKTGNDVKSVTAVTALSWVDEKGAQENFDREGTKNFSMRTFDSMKAEAQDVWERELESISLEGEEKDHTVFYTALYHSLLQPMTATDVDGRYRTVKGKTESVVARAVGWTYYEFFSLWDTFRAQNQLLAVLRPSRARDIALSIIDVREKGGWLPRWSYANFECNAQTGDPVTPFLVDLWRLGVLEGRERTVYEYLWENVNSAGPEDTRYYGRAGTERYLQKGFVQYDKNYPKRNYPGESESGMDIDPRHGASATLEYALADGVLSIMASALGEHEHADMLRNRGKNWMNLWNGSTSDEIPKTPKEPAVKFTGLFHPKGNDDSWLNNFDPSSSETGFQEGSAWHYHWLVQQDVGGLVEKLGGKANVETRLDKFFAYADLVENPRKARDYWPTEPHDYGKRRYNPNNEPDLHAPWFYTMIGRPWKTATVVRAAQTFFRNRSEGITGNDDLGTMSAWYVFSALGLYPFLPGSGQFLVHTPRFPKATISLENGKRIVIEAPTADGEKIQYVNTFHVDGKARDKVWVSWGGLRRGATLSFTLTTNPPTTGWGTKDDAAPPSPCSQGENVRTAVNDSADRSLD